MPRFQSAINEGKFLKLLFFIRIYIGIMPCIEYNLNIIYNVLIELY